METIAGFFDRIGTSLAGMVFSSVTLLGVDVQLIVLWLFAAGVLHVPARIPESARFCDRMARADRSLCRP